MSEWLPQVLQLVGSVTEIVGVVLMANGLLAGVTLGGVLRTLANATYRGANARGAIRMGELGDENRVSTLQGLAFVLFGFVLQAFGTILEMIFLR